MRSSLLLLAVLPRAAAPICPGLERTGGQWVTLLANGGTGPADETFCSGNHHAWYVNTNLIGNVCSGDSPSGTYPNNCVVLAPGIDISDSDTFKESWCAAVAASTGREG